MSQGPDDERLEELRKQKMEELKQQQQQQGGGKGQVDQEAIEQQQQQAEAQKKALLRQYLSDGARQRLNSVKMSKPDFGEKVEQQVIALAQSGRLGDQQIDEEQMKDLLRELKPEKKSFDIKRR